MQLNSLDMTKCSYGALSMLFGVGDFGVPYVWAETEQGRRVYSTYDRICARTAGVEVDDLALFEVAGIWTAIAAPGKELRADYRVLRGL